MRGRWLLVVATVLVIALVALATLQTRWINELADAEAQRERAAMDFAARHFLDAIDRDLGRTREQFQGGPRTELWRRYEQWRTDASEAPLVGAIYVLHAQRMEKMSLADGTFAPVDWAKELEPLRPWAERQPPGRPPYVERIPAIVVPLRPDRRPPMREGGPPPMTFFGGPPPRPPDTLSQPPRGEGPAGREGVLPPRGEGPAGREGLLPAPQGEAGQRPDEGPRDDPERPTPTFAAVVIDRAALASTYADLAKRYFNGYDVAVAEGDSIFYRSTPPWPRTANDRVEFERPISIMRPPDEGAPAYWRLLVRKHGESLEQIVATTRLRNGMVSFGVVAVLVGAFVLLAVIARRAERLRQQQLAFVAGITHELNTPLAAIESAGENLADGIVVDPDRVARYGSAIVKESRRLSDIVAQVLAYAGMQARATRNHEAVDVDAIIAKAVAACAWLAEQNGIAIETNVATNLPRIDGNADDLITAIRNLIVNAIRHGGIGQWVGVRAAAERGGVTITVEDRGPGLAPRDVPRLFEAFYRGGDSQSRGAGLGLAIVKQIAETHGGSVSAEKRRERGAAFTLRLPAAEASHA